MMRDWRTFSSTGVHACVGARVARLEGVSLLSALARHVRSIELDVI